METEMELTPGSIQSLIERTTRLEEQTIGIKNAVAEMKDSFENLSRSSNENSKDILDKLENMENRMEKRLTDSIKGFSIEVRRDQRDITRTIEELEQRIHTLEKWRWYVVGAAFSVSYLVSNSSIALKLFS